MIKFMIGLTIGLGIGLFISCQYSYDKAFLEGYNKYIKEKWIPVSCAPSEIPHIRTNPKIDIEKFKG